jgi:hypothetical protein
MPVCASCHDAIRDIYPKAREIYGKAETTTTYPAYNAASNQGCWICVKHAEFLEQYYPQVYQLWLKDPLIVTFRSRYVYGEGLQNTIPNQTPSGEPFPVESRGHRNLELQQLMFTRKHAGSNEEGCLIELRLYRDEGKNSRMRPKVWVILTSSRGSRSQTICTRQYVRRNRYSSNSRLDQELRGTSYTLPSLL